MVTVDFDRLAVKPGFKILDIGCGSGRHACAAYRCQNVIVIGVDLNFKELIEADDRLKLHDRLGEHGGGAWGLSAADLIAIESELGAHNYKPLDVVLTRGEGVWVWDVDGKRYLDCLSAYSAVNQGHCHPRIRAALIEQAGRLPLTSRAFRNDQLPLFYQEICALTNSHKVLR